MSECSSWLPFVGHRSLIGQSWLRFSSAALSELSAANGKSGSKPADEAVGVTCMFGWARSSRGLPPLQRESATHGSLPIAVRRLVRRPVRKGGKPRDERAHPEHAGYPDGFVGRLRSQSPFAALSSLKAALEKRSQE